MPGNGRSQRKSARLHDMASVKFQKGSEEWMMFMEFWGLCQKYWIPEQNDEWWDEALREMDLFAKKYGSTVCVRKFCMALIARLEDEHQEQMAKGKERQG